MGLARKMASHRLLVWIGECEFSRDMILLRCARAIAELVERLAPVRKPPDSSIHRTKTYPRGCGIRSARAVGQWALSCHVMIAVFYRFIYSDRSKSTMVAESTWLGKRRSLQQSAV
jgi:hypothetical protein